MVKRSLERSALFYGAREHAGVYLGLNLVTFEVRACVSTQCYVFHFSYLHVCFSFSSRCSGNYGFFLYTSSFSFNDACSSNQCRLSTTSSPPSLDPHLHLVTPFRPINYSPLLFVSALSSRENDHPLDVTDGMSLAFLLRGVI